MFVKVMYECMVACFWLTVYNSP